MSSRPRDIVLVTAREMPRPVPETALLVDALARLGRGAEVVPWDDPVDWAEVPLVVLRTPWDYPWRHAEFTAWLDRVGRATRLLNPAEVVRWNSHKGYLGELAAGGLPVVPTTLVRRGAAADEQAAALSAALRRSGTGEAVVKPAVSVGANGTLRGGADTAAAHLRTLAATEDALVQPFLPSIAAAGENSLIHFDGAFSHAVRKRAAAGDFRVQSDHGGTVEPSTPSQAELDVAAAVLAAVPAPVAYARIDLVGTDSGPVLMEAELIEPELFLGHHPRAAERFADAIVKHGAAAR